MLSKIVKNIKELRIQGATNIALASLNALQEVITKGNINELNKARKLLLNTRPNEPMMKNVINYVINQVESGKDGLKTINSLRKKIDEAGKLMIQAGAGMIRKNSIIFTHCHARSVMSIIKAAKNSIKMVYCTESRPRYQGRITAEELTKESLPVTMITDSAVANYIKKADYFLIGCDMITSTSIINKVGSRMISILCDKYDIPLYVCTLSYKFSPEPLKEIEERDTKEIWDHPPKGLKILNPAFDIVDFETITGFITELGVLPTDSFINLMHARKNKMFD